MYRAKPVFLILSMVLCAVVCQGQSPLKMTNDEIISYVALDIPDESIIADIRAAKDTAFDLSPAGIKAMKGERVSDAIINAMTEKQRTVDESEAQLGITGLPPFSGLYGKTANQWESLRKVPALENSTDEKTLSFGSHSKVKRHYTFKYANNSARLQIKGPRPTFLLRQEGASADFEELNIIRVEQKKNLRQVEWWTITDGQTTTMPPENPVVIRVHAKRLKEDIVAYTPDSDLTPGEYLMYGNNIGYAYQFAIVEQ